MDKVEINIKHDNNGIVTGGDLHIENLNFLMGQGVKSVSGIHGQENEAEYVDAEEIPVVDDRCQTYPQPTAEMLSFFSDTIWVGGKVTGTERHKLEIPKVEILHRIYDLSRDWNPENRDSVRKWKILYMVLKEKKWVEVWEKDRYKGFVDCVVKYCFPNVKQSYNGNISKVDLDESKSSYWEDEDQKILHTVRKAMNFYS